MSITSGRTTLVGVLLLSNFVFVSTTGAYGAATDMIKYLNPLPKKKGYLNQSQDRAIKKKAFKAGKMPVTKAVLNKESGFFAVIPSEKVNDQAYIGELLSNPRVNGVSVMFPWAVLNPTEDDYNWKPLDAIVDLAAKNNKTVMVRVSTAGLDWTEGKPVEALAPAAPAADTTPAAAAPTDTAAPKDAAASDAPAAASADAAADSKPADAAGAGKEKVVAITKMPLAPSDTPAWVFEDEVKYTDYVGRDGKWHTMPIFWDATYLAKWSNFVKDMGKRYDKNPAVHSVGITGGGFLGLQSVLPNWPLAETDVAQKADRAALRTRLEKENGLTGRKMVEHWKYVADLFPQGFATGRLNLTLNGPLPGRQGEDLLDEISDYLVYRYGNRVFLTRQGIHDGKHSFDDWRLLLKFHNDTTTGLGLTNDNTAEDLTKIAKTALEDGISYVEMPPELLLSQEPVMQQALDQLASHMGHQVIAQKVVIPAELPAGEKLPAQFSFINVGAASPIRPERAFDKDVAASFKVQLELRDKAGKPLVQTLHTPEMPTQMWAAGKPIEWDTELALSTLAPGEYTVWLSLIDPNTKRAIQFVDGRSEPHTVGQQFSLGTLKIVPASAKKVEAAGSEKSAESPK